ncbi:hypothetical protein [Legionella sp. CNM-4043-24]|uniref:hypothetical protein n=1 Tax=Legionella sp. CNM-4043-24 TaxID=3421646 RepID=UPI00403A8AA0
MSKTIRALMTKIQWQISGEQQRLEQLVTEKKALQLQLNDSRARTEQACAQPARLLPEQEMARLNFMMNQQPQQARLQSQIEERQVHHRQITEKIRRLNMELHLLETYQEKQSAKARQSRLNAEQNRADEWCLLRGEPG